MYSLFSRSRREHGFTLIELLTVIIIIGILAAVAIPVFSSQRGRAADSQTISDMRNIATATETYLADRTKTVADITKNGLEYASSADVTWNIAPNAAKNGYCIAAYNPKGKKYYSDATVLTYDSTGGGLGKAGDSCVGNTPAPNGATGTGSSTATNPTPVLNNANIVVAPNVLQSTSQSAPWAASRELGIYQMTVDSSTNTLYAADSDSWVGNSGNSLTNQGIRSVNMSSPTTHTYINTQRAYYGVVKVGSRLYASTTSSTGAIYEINTSSNSSTLRWTSDTRSYIYNLTTDGTNLYAVRYETKDIVRLTVNPDGSLSEATSVWTGLTGPMSATFDTTGNTMYVGDSDKVRSKNFYTGETRLVGTNNGQFTIYSIIATNGGTLYLGGAGTGTPNYFIARMTISNGLPPDAAQITGTGGNADIISGLATDGTRLYAAMNYHSTNSAYQGIYRF